MKFSLVELEELSGEKLKIYSLLIEDDELTLYDHFLEENTENFAEETTDITNRLEVMATRTGLRDDFIKMNRLCFQ